MAKAIRDHLDLDPSDRIKFSLHPDSGVDPTQDLDLGVEGASSISGPPRSFDAMETATTESAAEQCIARVCTDLQLASLTRKSKILRQRKVLIGDAATSALRLL